MENNITLSDDTLTKLKKFELSVKIDGKHPKHSGAIELAVDTVGEVKSLVDNCDKEDISCSLLYLELSDLLKKFD